ncbi:MAG TPA: MarR family winged helix-turn-helix transcriptional regulator [Solirubrobacteraceae bacterium]|nr:MarR family winged helix-turn-helix transcriptional regulator [Solirubrobacteraceae bacterium]
MPDPSSSLPTNALLRTAYNALSARIYAGVKAGRDFDDLRPAHGNAMEQLELEDGLRLTEMAARAGITVQSMGELVDDLEAKGYLQRRPDPHDRRAKRIHLTDRGRNNARIAKQAVADAENHLTALLGNQHYQQLRRALQQIIAGDTHDDERRGTAP